KKCHNQKKNIQITFKCYGSIQSSNLGYNKTVHLMKHYFEIFSITPVLMHIEIQTKVEASFDLKVDSTAEEVIEMSRKARIRFNKKNLGYSATIFFSPYIHNQSTGFSFTDNFCHPEFSVVVAYLVKPEHLASTVVHEIGHLFGLPHTTERDPDARKALIVKI
ncbi:hypothetical protein MXB_12, partial [Myxobolus squamalis]